MRWIRARKDNIDLQFPLFVDIDVAHIIRVTSSWAPWRLKLPPSRVFAQPFVQTYIKENIKAPRHWPLWGEPMGDLWIPLTRGQRRGKCFLLMTSSCIWNLPRVRLETQLFYIANFLFVDMIWRQREQWHWANFPQYLSFFGPEGLITIRTLLRLTMWNTCI